MHVKGWLVVRKKQIVIIWRTACDDHDRESKPVRPLHPIQYRYTHAIDGFECITAVHDRPPLLPRYRRVVIQTRSLPIRFPVNHYQTPNLMRGPTQHPQSPAINITIHQKPERKRKSKFDPSALDLSLVTGSVKYVRPDRLFS